MIRSIKRKTIRQLGGGHHELQIAIEEEKNMCKLEEKYMKEVEVSWKYTRAWADAQTDELSEFYDVLEELRVREQAVRQQLLDRHLNFTGMYQDILEQERALDNCAKEVKKAEDNLEKARAKLGKAQQKAKGVPEAATEVRECEQALVVAKELHETKRVEVKQFKNTRLKVGFAVYCKDRLRILQDMIGVVEAEEEAARLIPAVLGTKNGQWVFGDAGPRLVFGAPLCDIVAREGHAVPYVIRAVVAFLHARGALQMEGIFRLSGASSEVEKLVRLFNTGEPVNLATECTDEYAAAVLVKQFLREMPQSIIPTESYSALVACLGRPTEEDTLAALVALVNTLPAPNVAVLRYLLAFFLGVSKHMDKNKMSPNNLAIVLGPNLLRLPDLSPYEEMLAGQHLNDAACLLIKRALVVCGEAYMESFAAELAALAATAPAPSPARADSVASALAGSAAAAAPRDRTDSVASVSRDRTGSVAAGAPAAAASVPRDRTGSVAVAPRDRTDSVTALPRERAESIESAPRDRSPSVVSGSPVNCSTPVGSDKGGSTHVRSRSSSIDA